MALYTEARADLNKAVETFRGFETDSQLALLWYIYKEVGHSITPAAPDAAEPAIAGGLFQQVQHKPQEEQLQIMRDIVQNNNTEISREYGSLSANTRLAFWYALAIGMDHGSIIPMPDQYDLSDLENEWLGALQLLDFQSQITALRDIANAMGAEPAQGAKI